MGTVDDDGMSSEIEAAQQATTAAITGGSSRTWRITNAQLTNAGGLSQPHGRGNGCTAESKIYHCLLVHITNVR